MLGGAVAALALIYFPQCLNDPYAALGPMLQSYWLDAVDEAQPLWRMLAKEPETAAGHYPTVLIALAVLASAHAPTRALSRGHAGRGDAGRGTSG